MIRKQTRFHCVCECHPKCVIHEKPVCVCGKPIRPPAPGGEPERESCRPPPNPEWPGVVDVPQETVPPTFTAAPGSGSGPKPSDPAAQIPWFKNQVTNVLRKGPTFGSRKDEYLPYLLLRNAAGDRGRRPFNGVFWESPDIFVVPGQEADTAPLVPASIGGVTQANLPTTLYAHVWNLGKSPAYRIRVEFYWFNPTLGIGRADANFIGAAYVDLADRFTSYPDWKPISATYGSWLSRGNHAVVHCPQTWIPKFENGGHECIVVRAFEPIMDAVGPDQFSAARDRHVCQRNIAVAQAASPATIDMALNLGPIDTPSDIEIDVIAQDPNTMPWLQLYAQKRSPTFAQATESVVAGFLPPTVRDARLPMLSTIPIDARRALLRGRETFERGCCPLQIAFHASIQDLLPMHAQVLRIRQRSGGEVLGGYTVVLLKR